MYEVAGLQITGFLWVPMDSYEFKWIPMISMNSDGFQWIPLDSYRDSSDISDYTSTEELHQNTLKVHLQQHMKAGTISGLGHFCV